MGKEIGNEVDPYRINDGVRQVLWSTIQGVYGGAQAHVGYNLPSEVLHQSFPVFLPVPITDCFNTSSSLNRMTIM